VSRSFGLVAFRKKTVENSAKLGCSISGKPVAAPSSQSRFQQLTLSPRYVGVNPAFDFLICVGLVCDKTTSDTPVWTDFSFIG
jgi:hypothetical protein